MINIISNILATLTLAGDIFITAIILLFFAQLFFKNKLFKTIAHHLSPNAYTLVFFISLAATLSSLFYSEVAKYTPCVLCWYQRIFMYPQPLLLYLAMLRNERVLTPYLILMNIIGGFIAAYHYIIQISPQLSVLPCELGGQVSCTKAFTYHFGYITIPMMALTAFVLNIIFLLMSNSKLKVQSAKLKVK